MLDDKDKKRILEEETYRHEIKFQLAAKAAPVETSRIHRMFDLLSKPFSIWLLSSIVLTTLGWGFSKAQAEWEEYASRREMVRKLDTEINGRLLNARDELGVLRMWVENGNYQQINEAFVLNFFKFCLDGVPPPQDGRHIGCPGIYPEWSNRTFLSLLTQLALTVPKKEKKDLEQVRENARQILVKSGGGPFIAEKATVRPNEEETEKMLKLIGAVDQKIANEIQVERWRK